MLGIEQWDADNCWYEKVFTNIFVFNMQQVHVGCSLIFSLVQFLFSFFTIIY